MKTAVAHKRRNGKSARVLSELVGKAVEPVCRKRGFATADLLASWPDIVGERYGERVLPDKVLWPRNPDTAGTDAKPDPATLVVHTDGATALLLSHDMPAIINRINAFFGWAAIGRIRIVQRPVKAKPKTKRRPLRRLTSEEHGTLETRLKGVEHRGLRDALMKLGAQVIAREDGRTSDHRNMPSNNTPVKSS